MRFTPEATRFKIKQTEDQKNSLGKWLDTLNLDPKSKQTMEALSVSNQIPYDLIGALVGYITSISPREDEGILVLYVSISSHVQREVLSDSLTACQVWQKSNQRSRRSGLEYPRSISCLSTQICRTQSRSESSPRRPGGK